MRLVVPVLTRILSALASLALIAAGVVAAVEVVAAALERDPVVLPSDYAAQATRWQWDDRSVMVVLAVTGAVGVILLLTGLWRRAPLTIPVAGREGVAVERRGLEGSLSRRLAELDGVSSARVRVGRRRVRVRVDSRRRQAPERVRDAARALIDEALADQHLQLEPTVRLRYRGGEL